MSYLPITMINVFILLYLVCGRRSGHVSRMWCRHTRELPVTGCHVHQGLYTPNFSAGPDFPQH